MQNSSISDTQSAKRKTLEVVFIFLLFFIAGGDPTPAINEAQYLSKAKHFWNPDWCPDDHFLSSSDAHYVFYWTLGLLAKFTSLEATAWIGRCIGWLFLAIAWQRLSYRFCTKFGSAILSAAVWFTLTYRVHMAGEWVIGGIEAKVIAYGFVLLGLTALADRHWKRVWPYFGIAASFHVLVGGWSVVAAMIAWGLTKKEQRTSLFEMAPFVILGGLLSLPGLLPVLLLSRGIPEELVAEGARIYVFERLQHHLVFSSFAREFVARFFVMSILWAIGWMVLRSGQSQAAIGICCA